MMLRLFIYCDTKDDTIRKGCMDDYVLYQCGNIVFSDYGVIKVFESWYGNKNIKLVDKYIMVKCNVDDVTNEMTVVEVLEHDEDILNLLLRD